MSGLRHALRWASPLWSAGLAWWLLPVLFVVDAVWAAWLGWRVDVRSIAGTLVVTLVVAGLLLVPRYRADRRLSITVLATVQLLAFTKMAAMLSYLVVSTNAPLTDRTLAAWDAALGFDWVALATWIRSVPEFEVASSWAYYSGLPQMAVITITLGLSGRQSRVVEFVRLVMVSTVVTILISGVWPAAGPFKHFEGGRPHEIAALSHFESLRQGGPWTMFAAEPQGLISMPSLHTALGVLYVYAVRGMRWVFTTVLILNILMIASTPTVGGHYLVDILGGITLIIALIAIDQLLQRRLVTAGGLQQRLDLETSRS